MHEIQDKLEQVLMVEVSKEVSNAAICQCLKANGFTRQKLRITAIQQEEVLRQQYVHDITVYSSDMLVFLDETGADWRNVIRNYGYSLVENHCITTQC